MTTIQTPRRKFESGGILKMDQSGESFQFRKKMGGAKLVLNEAVWQAILT